MLFIRAHKDVTVIPRLVLSHSTAMPSSLSAVQLHGYTPAIISKIYYQSGSKNIIYVREREISYRILGTRSLAASGIERILTLLTLSQANLRQENC